MKTVAIKMKNYISSAPRNINQNINIVDNNNLRVRMLRFMFGSIGLLALSYVFILGSMVFDIVERKALESEARTLSSEVRELELTYLSMSDKIDLEFSRSLGFYEADASFATRKSDKSLGRIELASNEI